MNYFISASLSNTQPTSRNLDLIAEAKNSEGEDGRSKIAQGRKEMKSMKERVSHIDEDAVFEYYSCVFCLYVVVITGRRSAFNPDSIIIITMEIEGSSKRSRQSMLQRSSLRSSSIMSLERFSLPNSSLSRRVSLLSAMDLELSRHSSNLDPLGEPENRNSDAQRESVVYEYKIDVEERDLTRASNHRITHECQCSEDACMGVHCSCFLTPREICVIGQCCGACLATKNHYLQTTRGFMLERERLERRAAEQESNPLFALKQKNYKNMHYYKHAHPEEPLLKDLVFCTCKKSHCQKKYCLCFDKGLKCGQFCICIECENNDEEERFREEEQRRWERYATYQPYEEEKEKPIDPNIDQFLQKEEEEEQGELKMEFQPVNFDRLIYNSYQ